MTWNELPNEVQAMILEFLPLPNCILSRRLLFARARSITRIRLSRSPQLLEGLLSNIRDLHLYGSCSFDTKDILEAINIFSPTLHSLHVHYWKMKLDYILPKLTTIHTLKQITISHSRSGDPRTTPYLLETLPKSIENVSFYNSKHPRLTVQWIEWATQSQKILRLGFYSSPLLLRLLRRQWKREPYVTKPDHGPKFLHLRTDARPMHRDVDTFLRLFPKLQAITVEANQPGLWCC